MSEYHLGTATTPWVWGLADAASGRNEAGSYGVNGWLYPDCPYYEEDSDFPLGAPYFGKVFNVRKPAQTPSFGDCATVDSWPHDTNPLPSTKAELDEPIMEHALKTQIKRYCIDRHGMAINVSYMDGHVSKLRLEDLWLQKWHRDFKPRKVSFEWGTP
jgi:prepilin-type processing-associated H-X9-DG protein